MSEEVPCPLCGSPTYLVAHGNAIQSERDPTHQFSFDDLLTDPSEDTL